MSDRRSAPTDDYVEVTRHRDQETGPLARDENESSVAFEVTHTISQEANPVEEPSSMVTQIMLTLASVDMQHVVGIDPSQHPAIFHNIRFQDGISKISLCPPNLQMLRALSRDQKIMLLDVLAVEEDKIPPRSKLALFKQAIKLGQHDDIGSIMILSMFLRKRAPIDKMTAEHLDKAAAYEEMATELIGLAAPKTMKNLTENHLMHLHFKNNSFLVKLIHAAARAITQDRDGIPSRVVEDNIKYRRRDQTARAVVGLVRRLLCLFETTTEGDAGQHLDGIGGLYNEGNPQDLGVQMGIVHKAVHIIALRLPGLSSNHERLILGMEIGVALLGLVPVAGPTVGACLPVVKEGIKRWAKRREGEKTDYLIRVNDECRHKIAEALKAKEHQLGTESVQFRIFEREYYKGYRLVQEACNLSGYSR